jgi:hypothetical protein
VSLQPDGGALGFMPFYYQRFAWSTRGWPAEAALAYLFLLCEQYSNGGLNADPAVLDEIAPGTLAHWDRIKRKFTVGPDGLLRNIRCEEIRAKSLAAGDRKRQQARNAAAMRWHSGSNAGAMRNDANDNESDNEIESDSEKKETHTLNGSAVEPVSVQVETDQIRTKRKPMPPGALERLWSLFPRKVGKKRALVLLEKSIREYADEWELDALDDAVEVMRERIHAFSQASRKTEPKFIAHPSTWLAQGRYLDPVTQEK